MSKQQVELGNSIYLSQKHKSNVFPENSRKLMNLQKT